MQPRWQGHEGLLHKGLVDNAVDSCSCRFCIVHGTFAAHHPRPPVTGTALISTPRPFMHISYSYACPFSPQPISGRGLTPASLALTTTASHTASATKTLIPYRTVVALHHRHMRCWTSVIPHAQQSACTHTLVALFTFPNSLQFRDTRSALEC